MAATVSRSLPNGGGMRRPGPGPTSGKSTSPAALKVRHQPYQLSAANGHIRPSDMLSCSECRRRKVRCDRKTPCSGCLQRGTPQDCSPELRKHPPAVSSLVSDLSRLQQQLLHLESFIAGKHSDYMSLQRDILTDLSGLPAVSNDPSGQSGSQPHAPNIQHNNGQAASDRRYDILSANRSGTSEGAGSSQDEHAQSDGRIAAILDKYKDSDIMAATDKPSPVSEVLQINWSSPSAPLDFTENSAQAVSWKSSILQMRSESSWQSKVHRRISEIVEQLPSEETCDRILAIFFKISSWEIDILYREQLLGELLDFNALRKRGEAAGVEPAWLALLCMVLSLGYLFAHHYGGRGALGSQQEADALGMSTHYAELTKDALGLASWTSIPSIRTLQAVLLTGWRYHHLDAKNNPFDGSGDTRLAYKTLLHIAYEQCCALNIDKLQEDPQAMPTEDVSLPSTSCQLRRETGLRLWFARALIETLLSEPQRYYKRGSDAVVLPGMYLDSDLLALGPVSERALAEDITLVYRRLQQLAFTQLWEQKKLANEGKSHKIMLHAAKVFRRQLEDLIKEAEKITDLELAPVFGNWTGFTSFIALMASAAAIRPLKLALLASGLSHGLDVMRDAGAEAHNTAALAITPDLMPAMLCFPPAILFVYNAATLLLIALCFEPHGTAAGSFGKSIEGVLRLLNTIRLESRSFGMAHSAEKALMALRSLGRLLSQENQAAPADGRRQLEELFQQADTWTSNAEAGDLSTTLNSFPMQGDDFTFDARNFSHLTLTAALLPDDALFQSGDDISSDMDGWLKWLDAM